MEKQVFSGKTIEEAKEQALKELNLEEDKVIFIEKEEKKSLFSKKCEVEAVKKEEVIDFIKDYLKKLIADIGLEANIEYKSRDEIDYFNVITQNNSILIGKNGRTIDAIQIMVNQVVNNELGRYLKLQIDVADYKKKKQGRLEKLAKFTAKDVAMSKCEVKLDPMNSYERRIVHSILANSRDVETESVGEEPNRYIVVKPKKIENDKTE